MRTIVRGEGNTVRMNLLIRRDIKAGMLELVRKRTKEEGGSVSLGRLFGEAARILLNREHIMLDRVDGAAAEGHRGTDTARPRS